MKPCSLPGVSASSLPRLPTNFPAPVFPGESYCISIAELRALVDATRASADRAKIRLALLSGQPLLGKEVAPRRDGLG